MGYERVENWKHADVRRLAFERNPNDGRVMAVSFTVGPDHWHPHDPLPMAEAAAAVERASGQRIVFGPKVFEMPLEFSDEGGTEYVFEVE